MNSRKDSLNKPIPLFGRQNSASGGQFAYSDSSNNPGVLRKVSYQNDNSDQERIEPLGFKPFIKKPFGISLRDQISSVNPDFIQVKSNQAPNQKASTSTSHSGRRPYKISNQIKKSTRSNDSKASASETSEEVTPKRDDIMGRFLSDCVLQMGDDEDVYCQQRERENNSKASPKLKAQASANDNASVSKSSSFSREDVDDTFDIDLIEDNSSQCAQESNQENISESQFEEDCSDCCSDKDSDGLFTISPAEISSMCTVQQKQAVKDTEFIFVPVSNKNNFPFYFSLPKYKAVVNKINVRQKFGFLKPLENQLINTDDVKFLTTNLINFNETECMVYKGCKVEFGYVSNANRETIVVVFVADEDVVVLNNAARPLKQTDKWLPGVVVTVLPSNLFVRPIAVLKDTSRGTDVYVPNNKMPANALAIQRFDEVKLLFRDGKVKGKLMINKMIVTRYSGRSLRTILDYLKRTLDNLKCDGSLFIQLISLSYLFNYFTKIKFNSLNIQVYFLLHYMRFLMLVLNERDTRDDFCIIPFQDLILSANFNSNGALIKFLSSTQLDKSFKCKLSTEVVSIFDTVTEFFLAACRFDQSLLKRVYPFVCLINKFETSARVQSWVSKMLQFCITGEEIFCNDERWQDLRLIPNASEIWDVSMDNNENLSKVLIGQGYANGEEYMETYFRLLRAECFSPIQSGIKDLCADKLDPRDLNVYYNVRIRGYDINNSEFAFVISFSSVKRIKDWKFCSNLMFGNLLCLSPCGTFKNDLIWATVADRDVELLNRSQMIVIHLCRGINSLNPGEILFKFIENSGNISMVESPSYFLSFNPILETLQSFDIETFPLKKEIVFCQSQGAPNYLLKESVDFDASCIFSNMTENLSYDQLLLKLKTDESILDESQVTAIHHALSHRLAIIQGPPGCGKTFIGAKLAQIILSCLDESAGPILVLSYKNHALDEFLKHIIKFLGLKEVVRVGSRSKDSSLEECNLKTLERKERSLTLRESRMDVKHQVDDKIIELHDQIEVLYSTTKLTTVSFSKTLSELQLRSFFLEANYGSEIKFSIAKNVSLSRAGAKTLMESILKKYGELETFFSIEKPFGKNSQEEKFIKLFNYLMNVWFPRKDTLASLKAFHTAFVKEIEKIKERVKQIEAEDDTTDEWDEKAVENILQSRIEAFSGLSALNFKSENRIIWGDPSKDSRNLLVLNQLPQKLEVNHSILNADNMWYLTEAQRVHFLFSLMKTQFDKETISLNNILKELQVLKQLKKQIENSQRADLLKRKRVIGMTIVGACMQQNLIAEVKPSVVIVEEAAEILEPKLLATLTPNIQHLILIGDHMQLRPQIDTYPLRIKYNFDISMMERLVKSGYPFASLKRQNRMRCEFSALLRDIYPDLLDNHSIIKNNYPLNCLQNSMYFWTHRVEEISGRSYKNQEEVDRITALVDFLLLQNVSPYNITVLSSYQGQTHEIRKTIGRKGVNINTIDMYQGDENEYVIVSLVRSIKVPKKKNPIGFLAELNRRCVAQSRAKCGLYFVGNEETLSLNPHWKKLIDGMKEQNCVGPSLTIQCSKHKEKSKREVSSTEELVKVNIKPVKLCSLPCGDEMPCRIPEHACKHECMSAHQHDQCFVQVEMQFAKCGHKRSKACYQSETMFKCEENISITFRKCGHEIVKQCHENELLLKCYEKVDFKHKNCGHDGVKECHQNPLDIQCGASCERKMICGIHPCLGEVCGVEHSHSKCIALVKYSFPQCGHEAKRRKKCCDPINEKCSFEEKVDCGYGHAINKKCDEVAETCKFPCTRQRNCGHPCHQLCGEDCEKNLCPVCEKAIQLKIQKAKEDSDIRLQHLMLKMKMTDEFSITEIQKNSAEYTTVDDLVMKYIKPEHNWYPAITKIEKISNMKLLKLFNEALQEANDHYCAYKFHGTSQEGVNGISRDGFRVPVKAGMFGRGIYFATDSSKSAQEIYTKQSNKLLLCNVLLGKSKNVQAANNAMTLDSIRREGFDSVFAPRNTKGTGGVMNDEFVVFDPRQALPIYIISYSTASIGNIPSRNLNLGINHFKIEKLKPSRYLDFNNPYSALCQYAEGHFYKMLNQMQAGVGASNPKIKEIDIVENGLLEYRFNKKMTEFQNANIPHQPILVFHGTAVQNIDNILRTNLQMSYASRQAMGSGMYFSEFPNVSLGYGAGLILCQLLPGREYPDSTSSNIPAGYNSKLVRPNAALQNSSEMVIVTDSDQILPKFVYYLDK